MNLQLANTEEYIDRQFYGNNGSDPQFNAIQFKVDGLKNELKSGQGSGKIPHFNGTFYEHWKYRMLMYLKSMGPEISRIVEQGFTFENEEEPTSKDDVNIHRNAQAASVIISTLSLTEYTKVMGIKSAHQIWKKLEVIHEGTNFVKEAREDLLRGQYNLFIRKNGESPQKVHDRLMEIVNKRRALGTKLDDLEVNKRLLQALQPWNSHLCTLIRENENFKKFTADEVLGRLLAHQFQEQEARRVNALIGNTSPERKSIALKAKKTVVVECSSDDESDEELALLVKRFKKFLKKGGFTKKSYDKGKSRKSKRTCYECGEKGHFTVKCPNKSKEEKKKDKIFKNDKGKHHKNKYKGLT